MSSVANPVVPQVSDAPPARQQVPWAILTWFFFLLVLSYGPVLVRLVNQWNNDEDMGHGFFVPLIAGYIAWQKRDRLLGTHPDAQLLGTGSHSVRRFADVHRYAWAPSCSWRGPLL